MEAKEFQDTLDKGLSAIQQKHDADKQQLLDAIAQQRADWEKHYEELKAKGAPAEDALKVCENAMKRMDAWEAQATRAPGGFEQEKSVGERLVESEAFREAAKQMKPGGSYVSGKKITLPVQGFFTDEFKDITSAAVGNSTPGILTPQRLPGIVKPGIRKVRVRDLMTRMTTTQNAIEWLKENVFTNAASPVAETLSKPQSALTFTIDFIPIRTLAHWIRAAQQILDDFTLLQQYIDVRLIDGLRDVEDYELVSGDGTGQHVSGLNSEAIAYETTRNVASDTKFDTLNHAIAQIESYNLTPDGIIMNPNDWRNAQLIKTEEGGANKGMYLLGGPQGTADQTVWGLPVATTYAVATGKFYVGAFKQNCFIFDRMDARVDISTEDQDNFIKNLVTIRAEERMGFAVTRTNAVTYGSFVS